MLCSYMIQVGTFVAASYYLGQQEIGWGNNIADIGYVILFAAICLMVYNLIVPARKTLEQKQQSVQVSQTRIYCTSCGTENSIEATFCFNLTFQ